jgi:hypothetical protein
MAQPWWRTGLSGVVAGLVFSLLSGFTFYDIGVRSGVLFNPTYQSPKVLAVVPTMVIVRAPYIIFIGWTIILIGYAFLFALSVSCGRDERRAQRSKSLGGSAEPAGGSMTHSLARAAGMLCFKGNGSFWDL